MDYWATEALVSKISITITHWTPVQKWALTDQFWNCLLLQTQSLLVRCISSSHSTLSQTPSPSNELIFFLNFFPIFICYWSIHDLMSFVTIIFTHIVLGVEIKGVGWNHNNFSKGAIVSIIIGGKGDEFGEKTCKKDLNDSGDKRHATWRRITNHIQKLTILISFQILVDAEKLDLFSSKVSGELVSSFEMIIYQIAISRYGSSHLIIISNWSIIRTNKHYQVKQNVFFGIVLSLEHL